MASQIEQLDNSMVKMTVEVPQDEFKSALEQSFRKNAKRFTIPGFRKGKAPMKLVTNYYGEGVLYDDAIDIAVNPAYEKALEELDVKPFHSLICKLKRSDRIKVLHLIVLLQFVGSEFG